MPSALRTIVENVATTGTVTIDRSRTRFANEPIWHNGGVEFWFDGAHINSQPNQVDPVTGTQVNDLAQGRTAIWQLSTGTIKYEENGWDFGTITGANNSLNIPTDVTTSIWGSGTENQHFGIVLYLRLPTEENWNPSGNILPFFHFDSPNGMYADPSMASISAMTGTTSKLIRMHRPVSTSARDTLDITVPSAAFGKFCQLAGWRDAAGVHLQLRYDNGDTGAVASHAITGSGNATNNFSTREGVIGFRTNYTTFATSGAASRWKLYAGGVENLRVSGRNFSDVLTSDWAWRLKMMTDGIYA
ncbi:hypothetical protein GRI97_10555 [Altererythrobacter xixiisoli]|uniref:Uncharacterized protein n=1 Tax=Croceibacterium xixiisoli TaxID=1476466 RepID=A0A6I4TWD5_9SPHN|nr:hypothetical protein [Croceibacterium xixiisoli]MXO99431.1 hypothetical protein [Croceibacterium xixiisoli]